MQFQCQPVALAAQSHLPGHARAQHDLGISRRDAPRQGLGGVLHDVEQRLNELLAVTAEFGDRGVVVAHHGEAMRKFGDDECAHPFADFVDVDFSQSGSAPMWCEQAVHQGLQAIGFADDDLGVFLEGRIGQIHFEELGCTPQAPQGVLDFVGQAAYQGLVGHGLGDHAVFPVMTDLGFEREEFDDDLIRIVGLGDHDVHGQGVLPLAHEPGFIAQGGVVVAAGPPDGLQEYAGAGKEAGQSGAQQGVAGVAQCVFESRVGEQHAGRALLREMAWYDDYLDRGETNRAANTTPGNKKGGLANIVEKAMGSIAKSGTSAIVDVIAPGEKIRRKGLTYAATPASDFVCGTQQLASGMTIQVFTTGRGTPYGLEAAPVIKVATRSDLAARWHDLMEVDAGTIATGEATIEDVGWEIFRLILEVASGRKKTWADQWGLFNALAVFNPAPVT